MKGESFKLRAGKLIEAWRQYPSMVQQLNRMRPGPAIFVTGTHRSGTTWVAAMLSVPGIWYVHEPFSVTKGLWRENFTYVPAEASESEVDPIMKAIFDGGHRQMLNMPWTEAPLMPLRMLPHRPKRILLKDPLACLMSAYLTRRFGLRTLVLFRHPAGFVSSLEKLGWPRAEPIRRFLANEVLMRDWLEPYRNIMKRYSEKDSLEATTVFCGCLNRVLWGYVERNPELKPLYFEELCADPLAQFQSLYSELGLPYDDGVRDQHYRLCFAGGAEERNYRTHEVKRNSSMMAERWRKDLDQNAIVRIRAIWKEFEIPLYTESLCW